MEQHLIESLSKLSTSHLLILLVGYSIGKFTAVLIQAKKSASKARIILLQAELDRVRKQLEACQCQKN